MRSLVFLFLLSAPASAMDSRSPEWLRLGYWEGTENSWTSASSSPTFFISPDGRHSPDAELAATLASFRQNLASQKPLVDADPICHFPARFMRLAPELGADPTLVYKCPRFGAWAKSLAAKSISLIFASAFINSPSSMYGHTMLRINRGGKTEGQTLLDNVLGYGADTGNAGGISYTVLGLTGGFDGNFSLAPYYLKVHEYSNLENREFWEYELNFSPEELKLLIAHIWEVGPIRFPYYFLKRNCSYYLLRLLEAAKPQTNLAAYFKGWSIPVDTIRVLGRAGLIRNREFRASRWQRVVAARKQLSAAEIKIIPAVAGGDFAGLDSFAQKNQAAILDAAYEYFRFKAGIANVLTADQRKIEIELLSRRSLINAPALDLRVVGVAPEEGHPTQRLSASLGTYAKQKGQKYSFSEIRYRGAFHDLLQDKYGFEPNSELVMGDIRLRNEWSPDRLYVERVDVLRLVSVPPLDVWSKKISWSATISSRRAHEFVCEAWGCTIGHLSGGLGLSLALPLSQLSIFASGATEIGAVMARGFRVGMGPSALLRTNFSSHWQGSLVATRRYSFWGERVPWWELTAAEAYSWSRKHELMLEWQKVRTYQEYSLVYGYNF